MYAQTHSFEVCAPPKGSWNKQNIIFCYCCYRHCGCTDIEWPPRQVPGWQYIPGVERLTHTSRPYTAPYFAPNTATQLEEVLEAAGAPPFMITTQGAVISEAWPPNAWVRCADPCKGVYVPRALFQALHPLPRWLTLTLAAVEHPEDPGGWGRTPSTADQLG